ncbi:hypothetical protein MASR1M74_17090 [Lentimicrobium sp.]
MPGNQKGAAWPGKPLEKTFKMVFLFVCNYRIAFEKPIDKNNFSRNYEKICNNGAQISYVLYGFNTVGFM